MKKEKKWDEKRDEEERELRDDKWCVCKWNKNELKIDRRTIRRTESTM